MEIKDIKCKITSVGIVHWNLCNKIMKFNTEPGPTQHGETEYIIDFVNEKFNYVCYNQ